MASDVYISWMSFCRIGPISALWRSKNISTVCLSLVIYPSRGHFFSDTSLENSINICTNYLPNLFLWSVNKTTGNDRQLFQEFLSSGAIFLELLNHGYFWSHDIYASSQNNVTVWTTSCHLRLKHRWETHLYSLYGRKYNINFLSGKQNILTEVEWQIIDSGLLV